MTETPKNPAFEALCDLAAEAPVVVARPGKADVIILSAEAYAALVDKTQVVEPLQFSDDLLAAFEKTAG